MGRRADEEKQYMVTILSTQLFENVKLPKNEILNYFFQILTLYIESLCWGQRKVGLQ
jgi:hypothetical protein